MYGHEIYAGMRRFVYPDHFGGRISGILVVKDGEVDDFIAFSIEAMNLPAHGRRMPILKFPFVSDD
jgi:hypothetical protein